MSLKLILALFVLWVVAPAIDRWVERRDARRQEAAEAEAAATEEATAS